MGGESLSERDFWEGSSPFLHRLVLYITDNIAKGTQTYYIMSKGIVENSQLQLHGNRGEQYQNIISGLDAFQKQRDLLSLLCLQIN